MNSKLLIDSLIVIDDNGMPKPPTTRQLIDRDIRDTTEDKNVISNSSIESSSVKKHVINPITV